MLYPTNKYRAQLGRSPILQRRDPELLTICGMTDI